jgi:hypothetical protein
MIPSGATANLLSFSLLSAQASGNSGDTELGGVTMPRASSELWVPRLGSSTYTVRLVGSGSGAAPAGGDVDQEAWVPAATSLVSSGGDDHGMPAWSFRSSATSSAPEALGRRPSSAAPALVDPGIWELASEVHGGRHFADVAEVVGRILRAIGSSVATQGSVRRVVAVLPPLLAEVADDGALIVEWRSDRWLLAVTLEPDARDCGWYSVDLRSGTPTTASGPLRTFAPTEIVRSFLSG